MAVKTNLILGSSENLTVSYLDWDSKVLERRCASISEMSEVVEGQKFDYSSLPSEFIKHKWEYVIVRRPQSEWPRIQAMEDAGFRTVDGIVEFVRELQNLTPVRVPDNYQVRLAEKNDADKVGDLAVKTFSISRFHNDPLLTKVQVDRVHREWARNSCLGQAADGVLLIETEESLSGFITCGIKDNVGTIGLIGVDPHDSGKGLGAVLVQKACHWFAEQGCQWVRVLTQTNNHAAMKLYTRTGFDPVGTFVTLRWSITSQR